MDAMSGRGELKDWGLVADFYGLGEWVEYRTERTGADGRNTGLSGVGRTSGLADYEILDEADWGIRGGLADRVDWGG